MTQSNLKKNCLLRLLGFAFLLVAVSVGVSLVTANLVMHDKEWRHDRAHGHDWLREELGLNEQEFGSINAYEAVYWEQRALLVEEFNGKIRNLAEILRTSDRYSEEMVHAIHQLHEVHGKLQILSIQHYYDMLSVLPPEKQDQLRDLAIEALSVPE